MEVCPAEEASSMSRDILSLWEALRWQLGALFVPWDLSKQHFASISARTYNMKMHPPHEGLVRNN